MGKPDGSIQNGQNGKIQFANKIYWEVTHTQKKFNLDVFYLEKEMKIFVQRLSFMVYWDSCKVVADSGNYFWRLRKANLYCCRTQCEKLTFTKKKNREINQH